MPTPIENFWKDRRVVVTGAAGLVGSHLCDLLVDAGARVRGVDDLSKGILQRLEHLQSRMEFVQGDLCREGVAHDFFKGQEVVMHLASRAYGIAYSRPHDGEMFAFNLEINTRVLEACRMAKIRRLCAVSSSCVYPDDAPSPTPETASDRGEPESANRGYGRAKRQLEMDARELARVVGVEVAIVRPFNAYSERYKWEGEYSHIIPMLIRRIMEGQDPLVIWGSGRQRRNFLHAIDFARAFMAVTEHYAVADPVNVGYEETIGMAELAQLIASLAGRRVSITFDPSKPEGRLIKSADSARLRRVTGGIGPTIPLEQGLRRMLDWHRSVFSKTSPLS